MGLGIFLSFLEKIGRQNRLLLGTFELEFVSREKVSRPVELISDICMSFHKQNAISMCIQLLFSEKKTQKLLHFMITFVILLPLAGGETVTDSIKSVAHEEWLYQGTVSHSSIVCLHRGLLLSGVRNFLTILQVLC